MRAKIIRFHKARAISKPDSFDEALKDVLAKPANKTSQDAPKSSTTTSSLSQAAISQIFGKLEKSIQSSFACGGTIRIAHHKETSQPPEKKQKTGTKKSISASSKTTSPPVNIFWAAETGSPTQKLVLPSENTLVLQQLVEDCEPATFGQGQKDVLDPKYRKAGKMDTDKFARTFHPADFGIVENMEQILLPSVSTDKENSLGFRKLRVE